MTDHHDLIIDKPITSTLEKTIIALLVIIVFGLFSLYLFATEKVATEKAATEKVTKEKSTIFGYSDYAPYMDGKKEAAKGIYSELIKAVFKHANIEIKLVILPWKRALRSAEKRFGRLGGHFKKPKT